MGSDQYRISDRMFHPMILRRVGGENLTGELGGRSSRKGRAGSNDVGEKILRHGRIRVSPDGPGGTKRE